MATNAPCALRSAYSQASPSSLCSAALPHSKLTSTPHVGSHSHPCAPIRSLIRRRISKPMPPCHLSRTLGPGHFSSPCYGQPNFPSSLSIILPPLVSSYSITRSTSTTSVSRYYRPTAADRYPPRPSFFPLLFSLPPVLPAPAFLRSRSVLWERDHPQGVGRGIEFRGPRSAKQASVPSPTKTYDPCALAAPPAAPAVIAAASAAAAALTPWTVHPFLRDLILARAGGWMGMDGQTDRRADARDARRESPLSATAQPG